MSAREGRKDDAGRRGERSEPGIQDGGSQSQLRKRPRSGEPNADAEGLLASTQHRSSTRSRDRSKSRGKRPRQDVPAVQQHRYSTRSQDGGAGRGNVDTSGRRRSGLRGLDSAGEPRSKSSGFREPAPEPTSTSYSSYRFLQGKASPPYRPDDDRGHYKYILGENFTKRYKILSHLGEGTFGKVIECWDRLREQYVAIKVIRNVPKYRGAGMLELAVLNTVRKQKGNFKGGAHCVQFKEWFDYRGHICIVFAKLGLSLFDLLRKNNYRPFDLYHVQAFARQLLETVAFLHSIRLVHTDLKPENILLPSHKYYKVQPTKGSRRGKRVPEKADLYLIDFGSATFEDQHHSKVVSTRHYRAPEVMLGLGWSFPCDIWSLGCIVVELVTGEALFKTHDNLEHLAMMQRVLGEIPPGMVTSTSKEYFSDGKLAWPERCQLSDSVQAVNELKDLKVLVQERCDSSVQPHVDSLVEMLRGMLRFDPTRRITAKEALGSAFFEVQAKPPDY